MKCSRAIAALLLLTMIFSLCACGEESSPHANPTPTPVQDVTPATATPAPTERPTETGYIATEIAAPDWVKKWYSCDIANDTFYIGTDTTDGGLAVTAFDTVAEEYHRYDIDAQGLHNAKTFYISAADNSLWVYVYECRTEEEVQSKANVGEMRQFIAYIDLATGQQTLNEITFWEDSFNSPMYLIALDDDRAILGNGSITEIEGATGYNNFIIDRDVNAIARAEVDIMGNAQRVRVDGTLYLSTAQGLAPFDTDTLQFGAPIDALTNQPTLYSSSCGHL